jgi:uncharacterized protein
LRNPPNERPKLKLRHNPGAPAKAGALDSASEPVIGRAELRPSPEHKAEKDGPERRCVLTGAKADRAGLIRLVTAPDGTVLPDVRAKAPGRGAWIGVDRRTLEQAIGGKLKGALGRAFRRRDLIIPADLGEQIERQLERAALDRLGLEARAGTLLTGSDRIEEAARAGRVQLLLHACDAGEDGNRKLDQAWRVGRDEEGSALRGLVIAADRTILSAALGRENVVHVATTDSGAARRLSEVLTRWHGFIGFVSGERPCGSASQGSIAAAAPQGAAAQAANEGLTTVHE